MQSIQQIEIVQLLLRQEVFYRVSDQFSMTAATFILHLQNAFVAALALPALMCPV
jgi:hypothetical protein